MQTRLAYGRGYLKIDVPDRAAVLQPAPVDALADPVEAIEQALARPIRSRPLAELAAEEKGGTACVVVSDITRPVPYRTLLPPLLGTLEAAGIAREHILILIATGMHRASTPEERVEMFGEDVCRNYRIQDHDASDESALWTLPQRTSHGTRVSLDRAYLEADLKIATGLVEPHFMAGYSGGRKAICPGLANLATVQNFHGTDFLEHPCAAAGVLEGNPCHQEASDVARIAGVDFLLNVALNLDREIAGVFAGDLEMAFQEVVRFVDSTCRARTEYEADLVITSGGGYPLDKTLYQVVKGMVGALPVVKPGGRILIAGECSEGVGSPEYEQLMLEYSGRHREFLRDIISSPEVRKDQWELEMHCKVLEKIGPENLVLITRGIGPDLLPRMSVSSGYEFTASSDSQQMLQDNIRAALACAPDTPRIAVIPDGPYVLTGCESR